MQIEQSIIDKIQIDNEIIENNNTYFQTVLNNINKYYQNMLLFDDLNSLELYQELINKVQSINQLIKYWDKYIKSNKSINIECLDIHKQICKMIITFKEHKTKCLDLQNILYSLRRNYFNEQKK